MAILSRKPLKDYHQDTDTIDKTIVDVWTKRREQAIKELTRKQADQITIEQEEIDKSNAEIWGLQNQLKIIQGEI